MQVNMVSGAKPHVYNEWPLVALSAHDVGIWEACMAANIPPPAPMSFTTDWSWTFSRGGGSILLSHLPSQPKGGQALDPKKDIGHLKYIICERYMFTVL